MTFLTVWLFIVSVPVLSLAIMVQLPNPSTAASFLTITFFLAILEVEIERATVMATGRPSGIAETARATERKNMSCSGIP